MPDMKTALTKALQEWSTNDVEPDVQAAAQQPAAAPATQAAPINISRALFDYVKQFPGVTKLHVVNALSDNYGYKRTTLYALIRLMERQRVVQFKDGRLFLLVESYVPLKSALSLTAMEKRMGVDRPVAPEQEKARARALKWIAHKKGSAAPTPDPQETPAPAEPTPVVRNTHVNRSKLLLENMPVYEAFALYKELHNMFGGSDA